MNNNEIGDAGAAALGAALPRASHLEKLALECNAIGDAGATALAEGVSQAPMLSGCTPLLEKLWLHSNAIGDVGASALRNAMPPAPNLKVLDLRDNPVSQEVRSTLRASRGVAA